MLATAQLTLAQQPASSTVSAHGPLSIGVLVDGSAVKSGNASVIRNAIKTFLHSLRPPDEYALFTSTDSFKVAQDFTKDASLADDPIRRLAPARACVLYDSIIFGQQYVSAHGSNQRKALLVVSSGVDNGCQVKLNDVVLAAQHASLSVFVITLPGEGARAWNLEQLAALSNGAAYLPLQQSDLTGVTQIAAREVIGPPLPPEKPVPPRKPLAGYSELIVRSIPAPTSEDISDFDPGDNVLLQKLLVSSLEKEKIFATVTDGAGKPADDASAGAAPNSKLELVGAIVDYRRGSHFKRTTAGWLGSGVARLKVEFTLRDVATGKTVLAIDESGSGSPGFLGGANNDENQNQAMRRLVNNLLKDLQRNR